MFNFFKKKKKVNVIANRIKNLDNKLWLIYMTGKEASVERRIRYSRNNETEIGTSREYRVITLETYFGERKIATDGNVLYYGNNDLIQDSNEHGDWSFNFNYLFFIKIMDDGSTTVRFSEDVNITKENVDLAILEFELAVESMYTRMVEGKKSYDNMVDYLVNGV